MRFHLLAMRNDNMRLSIIIPAYNCQDYIKTTILSSVNQDLKPNEYEIIVINDGSTDNTKPILTELSQQHTNIVLKSQENLGVGSARNNGLAIAKGKYIFYLDADDYLVSNTLGKIISEAEKNNLDIISFKSRTIKDHQKIRTNTLESNINSIKLNPVLDGISYIGQFNYKPEIWWYFIKREFLIKIDLKFYPRKFTQDSFYTPILFLKATRIALLPLHVHNYRLTNNSVTRTKTPSHIRKHLNDMTFAINKLKGVVDNIPKTSKNILCIQQIDQKINYYTFLIFTRIIKSDLTKQEVNSRIVNFKKTGLYPLKPINGKSLNSLKFNYIFKIIINSKTLFYWSRKVYKLVS